MTRAFKHKMAPEELREWLIVRKRGRRIPDKRKAVSKQACRDRKLWGS